MEESGEEHQSIPLEFHRALSFRRIHVNASAKTWEIANGEEKLEVDTNKTNSNDSNNNDKERGNEYHSNQDDDEFDFLLSPSPLLPLPQAERKNNIQPLHITTPQDEDELHGAMLLQQHQRRLNAFVRIPSVHLLHFRESLRTNNKRRYSRCSWCACCCNNHHCCDCCYSYYFRSKWISCCCRLLVIFAFLGGILNASIPTMWQGNTITTTTFQHKSTGTPSESSMTTSAAVDDDFFYWTSSSLSSSSITSSQHPLRIRGDYSTVQSTHDLMVLAANVPIMCLDQSNNDHNSDSSSLASSSDKNQHHHHDNNKIIMTTRRRRRKNPNNVDDDADDDDLQNCPCAVWSNDDAVNTRTTPQPGRRQGWKETHQRNVQLANLEHLSLFADPYSNKKNWKTKAKKDTLSSPSSPNVVFMGDSITERWFGTRLGKMDRQDLMDTRRIFLDLFSNSNHQSSATGDDHTTTTTTMIHGLPLGIAGDQTPNLLWRLQNGELPDILQPKVFVVLIGTNDLSKDKCSPENVVVGIIRIVELLIMKRPHATVFLHGLLPRTYDKDGYLSKPPAADGIIRYYWGNYFRNEGNSSSAEKNEMPNFWPDIQVINHELSGYAKFRDQVEYMDTSVFFQDGEEMSRVNMELMPDGLHPSPKGYLLWGEEIKQKLLQELNR